MIGVRKTVLITGCTPPGIGFALAEAFREKDYHVFATLRDPSKLPERFSSAPNVTALQLDVLSHTSIAAAVEKVKEKTGGKLDVLVNNSGTNAVRPALDHPLEEARNIVDLNYLAPMAMLQAFGPMLVNAKGCVVNNTSVNGLIPIPLMSVYNASKAALITASETWRVELQPLGVRCVTIMTGGVSTGSLSKLPHVDLPSTSYYRGIQDFINKQSDGSMQAKGADPKEYASKVVQEIDSGATGKIYAGAGAAGAKWAGLLPQWIMNMAVEGIFPFAAAMAKAAEKK